MRKREKGKGGKEKSRTCSSISSNTRASTALSSSARLRAADGYGASVSTRYVRQFSTNTGRSHALPAPPAAAMAGVACLRRAASFSPAAATHILTAGSTSASSARSIVALFSAPPISPSSSASPSPSPSDSAVCRARIARRSCACVRSACGGVRDVSAWSREMRARARPCAAIASKKTAYDAAVVL